MSIVVRMVALGQDSVGGHRETVGINDVWWYPFVGNAADMLANVLATADEAGAGQQHPESQSIMELGDAIVDANHLMLASIGTSKNVTKYVKHDLRWF